MPGENPVRKPYTGPPQFFELRAFEVDRWRTCQRKKAYGRKRAALAAIEKLRGQGQDSQGLLHAYRCRFCAAWHIGRQWGKP